MHYLRFTDLRLYHNSYDYDVHLKLYAYADGALSGTAMPWSDAPEISYDDIEVDLIDAEGVVVSTLRPNQEELDELFPRLRDEVESKLGELEAGGLSSWDKEYEPEH